MAIKVGGTEVVDNNRQLKNIASVDATTVAALGTAGVGSGGGKFSATADGAIAIGKPVALQTNGTVKQVVETINELGTPTASSPINIHTNSNNSIGNTHYFPSENLYVYFTQISSDILGWTFPFNHSANSLGNFAANGITVDGGNCDQDLRSAFDPATGKFMLTCKNGGNVRVVSGIVNSGGGFTINTATDHAAMRGGDYCHDVVFSSTDNKFLIGYITTGAAVRVQGYSVNSNGLASTVGGITTVATSLSFSNVGMAYDSDNNRYLLAGRDNADGDKGKSVYFSHTSSGYTLHATTSWESTQYLNIQKIRVAYNPEYNRFAIIYEKYQQGDRVQLLTVSGTSISAGGSAAQFTNGASQTRQIVYDPLTHKMIVFFTTSAGTAFKTIDVSSTVASVGSNISVDTNTTQQECHLAYNTTDDVFAALFWAGNHTRLATLTTAQATSNNTSWIGFAESAISDTATGDILVLGSTAENQSGLTIGSTYYVQANGTLATTSINAVKVGRAIAANKLLITEGNVS